MTRFTRTHWRGTSRLLGCIYRHRGAWWAWR